MNFLNNSSMRINFLISIISTAFIFISHAVFAANSGLTVYPSSVIAPIGTYQTVTAVVTGVNNKTVTWTAPDGGTIVGTNPCVVNEPCTVALHSVAVGIYRLIATSNANNSVMATSTITFTPSPAPVQGHPRLIVTAAMLPGLQAKATAGNPMYQGIHNGATAYLTKDNTTWSWSCKGGTGLPSSDQSNNYREIDANYFAFLSMVAPTAAERNQWGCYGRDVWTYVMTQVINGNTSFAANHWSDDSPYFTLTTDWLMAGGYLSTADQTLARQFLTYAAQKIIPS